MRLFSVGLKLFRRPVQTGIVTLFVLIPSVQADVVEAWNNAILDSIRTENTHPCVAARALAIVHGAMYDVSAAIHKEPALHANEPVPGGLDLIPALNSAAYATATNLFPSRTAALAEVYSRLLRELPETPSRPASLRFGRAIADSWITWRVNDGSGGSMPYVPETQPGAWRRTPPFFRPPEMQYWARVVPFTLVSGAQFRSLGPPALSSAKYTSDFNLVKELGAAKGSKRTPEQTETAYFWSDFSYTVTPPGHWNQAAQAVAIARNMSVPEKVRLFGILNLTMFDVSIACWETKYAYNFWRPVTAIRAANSDDNPNTEADSNWMPLLNTPAFPEYISGHSAFSGVGATILSNFNGGDRVKFSVPSDSLPGKVRTYESLWGCASEVSRSRLYGGIHFPSALDDGLEVGRRVAKYVLENHLNQPSLPAVYTASGELNRSPWVGALTRPGRRVTLERLSSDGSWNTFTNGIATGPTIRWQIADLTPASAFRIKPSDSRN